MHFDVDARAAHVVVGARSSRKGAGLIIFGGAVWFLSAVFVDEVLFKSRARSRLRRGPSTGPVATVPA